MKWYTAPCAEPCEASRAAALARQQQLTKPPGSLGQLEHLAINFAAWQGKPLPALGKIGVRVFAADHGVCAQGVSAFPAEVTVQMINNFVAGGAAISVLSRDCGADFSVVNMGTLEPTPRAGGLVDMSTVPGTQDFTLQEAMTADTLQLSLEAGRKQVEQLDCSLFIAGEMGIGNTSSASVITAALLALPAEAVVGRGTGIDDEGLRRKRAAVATALDLHKFSMASPEDILRCVGGLEIAAMTGAYLGAAQLGIPILLDGFISTAAALVAVRINPGASDWMIAGHRSVEPAHTLLLDALNLRPLLDLDMRLGEGSGAAVAVGIVQSALILHSEMATFDQAGVANSGES